MDFNDKIIREALIYCVNHTKNKSNDGLKNYILNEMTKEELLSVYWVGKVISEGEQVDLPYWAILPLWAIAGGYTRDLIKPYLSKPYFHKKYLKKGFIDPSLAGEALAAAGIIFGATLLARFVHSMYKKLTNKCMIRCKKIIKPNKNYSAQVSVCFHQCKVKSFQGIINKLRSERSMCGQSRYPEKCVQNIDNQIIKQQAELEKELFRLQKSKRALFARLRKIPVAMSSKPSLEKSPGK